MRRGNRDVANDFEQRENLSFRWFSDWVIDDGRLNPDQIPIPNQSVNRESLGGRCWYVLIPRSRGNEAESQRREPIRRRLCQGIVQITVNGIPSPYVGTDGSTYTFHVNHDPLDDNYHHCEICGLRDGERLHAKKQTKFVKKHYRTMVADAASLVLKPEIGTGKSLTAK